MPKCQLSIYILPIYDKKPGNKLPGLYIISEGKCLIYTRLFLYNILIKFECRSLKLLVFFF